MKETGTVKVGIVGSGLSGLVAAHLLYQYNNHSVVNQIKYDVHLFERAPSLGMDSNSHTITTSSGVQFRVDSPMRAMQGGSHDRVLQLYRHLRIPLTRKNFDYSFFYPRVSSKKTPKHQSKLQQDDIRLLYSGSNGLTNFPPFSLPSSSTIWDHVSIVFAYVLLVVLSFGIKALANSPWKWTRTAGKAIEGWELGDLEKVPFIKGMFLQEILVPLFACVATADVKTINRLPLRCVSDYIADTFLTDHVVTANGVQEVVKRLIQTFPQSQIHLGDSGTVTNLSISSSSFSPQITITTSTSETHTFDYLIFALPAHQSLQLFESFQTSSIDKSETLKLLEKERLEALKKFQWAPSLVIDHTDVEAVLPKNKEMWRDLNIALSSMKNPLPNVDEGEEIRKPGDRKFSNVMSRDHVMATHILSRTHPILNYNVIENRDKDLILQTTNPTVEIDESKVLKKSWYERAIVTLESQKELSKFLIPSGRKKGMIEDVRGRDGMLQGVGGIYLCGSWCGRGIPLLDSCVTSAEMVVEAVWKKDHEGEAPSVPWNDK